jgi:CubicO group peptidase (beta-lactamase class C family)
MVVDIWGGHADAARTKQWAEHTIVSVWSSTKTVTSLTALMLVDRGLLDLNTPVARYWPEFAVNGKQDIEVRHILSHTSGVSGWDAPFTIEDVYDWAKSTSQLARQAPWWPPGTASGYHALTFGHGNARSLARTLSPISLGGKANGVQLLRPTTIGQIFTVQSNGMDLVLGVPLRWGVGYGLPTPKTVPMVPDEKICFWGGWGGSMVLINPDRRTTVAYVMNKMGQGTLGNERTAKYASLIYEALA